MLELHAWLLIIERSRKEDPITAYSPVNILVLSGLLTCEQADRSIILSDDQPFMNASV